MIGKSNTYLGVVLDDTVLKLAHWKGSGINSKVTQVVTKGIEGIPDGALSKVIHSALAGVKYKTANILYILPPSLTITKNIEIPSVNPEEIKSIVSLQAGRHTPYSREEIEVGYIHLGTLKENYTKVLLVIANRSTLKKKLKILEGAGLKVDKVLFAPEGIANFYSHALQLKKNDSSVGIIDIGRTTTEFIVLDNGKVIASRNIPIGRAQFAADGTNARDKLTDELSKTIESYRHDDIGSIPLNYIFTTEDEYVQDLLPYIKDKLNWDFKVDSYLDHVKAHQGVLKRLATDEYRDSSFLDVMALASIAESEQINLFPEDVKLQESVEQQGREVFKASVLGFIILMLIASILVLRFYFRDSFLNKLVKEYQSNRQAVTELEDLSIRTRIIQNYLNSRMVSLDLINEIYKNLPNEIYLTSIFMDEEGSISLQGISDIASIVFNLGTSLKESKFFKSVEIKSTTAKKDRGKDVSAFEITLKLQSALEEDVIVSEEIDEQEE